MSNNAYIVSAVRTAGVRKMAVCQLGIQLILGAKVLDELVYRSGLNQN